MATHSTPRLTQPVFMRTRKYDAGVGVVNGNDLWALFVACTVGDLSKVKRLLAGDPRLANGQFWYQCPLHPAVREGHLDIVKLLLETGTDAGRSPYLFSAWGNLLGIARERGYRKIERLLLKSMRRRFNYQPNFDQLKLAIESRNWRKVKSVLRRQPKLLKATDMLGNNALHWAVSTRQLKMVNRFVELGVSLNGRRADGQTPALLALSWWRPLPEPKWLRNRWVVLGHLLAHGAEYTLPLAAAVGDQERVEELLVRYPDAAFEVDAGMAGAITYAAREGHDHIVQTLLDHWPKSKAREHRGPLDLALFFACWSNQLETAQRLLAHGADPNAGADSCGCCLTIGKVSHGAAAKPMQRLLRKHGAYDPPYDMTVAQLKRAVREQHQVVNHDEFLGNVMAKNNRELIELFVEMNPSALKNMHHWGGHVLPRSPRLVRRLIDLGLDVKQTDWMGSTFLHAAAREFNVSNAEALLAGGADIEALEIEHRHTPLAAAVASDCGCADDEDHERCRRRRLEMIRFLLRRGAMKNVPDVPDRAAPLAIARERKLEEIEKLLLA